ncbi:MAG: hypothetical protein IJ228_08455 [Succinivibrio sp.]|nr:hypothetical protein [Succinivibrio sp.]
MWLALIISIPLLFVVGISYNAYKEQKKLEQGELKSILSEREQERKRMPPASGHKSPGSVDRNAAWDDDDDWGAPVSSAKNASKRSDAENSGSVR